MSTSDPRFQSSAQGVVSEGDVLGGKYRVEKVIGEGGMGVVVAATHLQLDEKYAIKLLLPDALKSPEVVRRFLTEARAAVKIKSEHVARVTDVGTLESGAPYMVMEFLNGRDLCDEIQATGPMSPDLAMEYVLQASEAIAEAHAAGIVHRDLKPANLFLTRRADGSPCIKVLDFGISKINDGSHSKTKTSTVMGSPAYMSPEQMRSSKDVDGRTDIWALGAIMYELLAGAPPFDADTVPQLCMKIMNDPLPALRGVRPDVPASLEAVIQRCQEKDAGRRFQHIGELAAALAPLVTGRARISADRVVDVAAGANLGARNSAGVTSAGSTFPPSSSSPGSGAGTMAQAPMAGNFANAATVATDAAVTTGSSSGSFAPAGGAQKKSGAMLIAAVVAALLIGGGAVAFLRGGETPPPAPAGNASNAENITAPTASAGPLRPVVTVASDPIPSASASASASPASSAAAAEPSATANAGATTTAAPKGILGKALTTKVPTKVPTTKTGSDLFNDRN